MPEKDLVKFKFKATLIKNDTRTDYKKGWTKFPKGFYYQKETVILVGDMGTKNTVRLSFPIDSIKIEIYNNLKLQEA